MTAFFSSVHILDTDLLLDVQLANISSKLVACGVYRQTSFNFYEVQDEFFFCFRGHALSGVRRSLESIDLWVPFISVSLFVAIDFGKVSGFRAHILQHHDSSSKFFSYLETITSSYTFSSLLPNLQKEKWIVFFEEFCWSCSTVWWQFVLTILNIKTS